MIESNSTLSRFHTYIAAGVQVSLARVRAAEYVVSEVDRQQAWHILSFALDVPEAWPVTRELLLTLAPKMEQAGFREEWIPYLEKGLHCAQRASDGQAAAECELQMGLLYRLLSRFEQAQRWTAASVDHFAAQRDAHGQARALNELAWLEQLQYRYEDATQHVEQALMLIADGDPECAMSYRLQGMIAIGQNHLQKAEAGHRKALIGFEEQQDQRKIAWGLQNIAYTLREQKKFEEAITLYQSARDILQAISDVYYYAFVTLNLGTTYLYFGEPATALACYHDAQTRFAQLHNTLYLAHIQNNVGLCYLALQQLDQAEKAFKSAITLFENMAERAWLLNAMDGLAMTYLALAQFDQAITILEAAHAALPEIRETPNYPYLHQSLHQHLQSAYQGQPLPLSGNG